MGWSSALTIAEPVDEPISLKQVKEFVSIEGDEFDTLLTGFIAAARDHAQAITGTRLVEQTVQLRADAWSDLHELPIGPVSGIASIVFEDRYGAEQVVPETVYELIGEGLARGIRPQVGQNWPGDRRSASGTIRVALTVGYAILPPSIETALLVMVGDQFAFRESGIVGTVAAAIKSSMQVDAMLTNHRIWM